MITMLHRKLPITALCITVLGAWLSVLLLVGYATGSVASGDKFNLPIWIVAHLSRTWLNPVARRLGGGYGLATDAQVIDFLGGSSSVAAAERDVAFAEASGSDNSSAEIELRRRIESLHYLTWPVEERIATELSTAIRSQGLDSALPAFSQISVVWPPVVFAYDLPPFVQVESPRARIELEEATLLRSDLPSSEAARRIAQVEARGTSAMVVRIGGLAAYPSVVEEDDAYSDAVDLVAHEWTHQYLFFHPLGIRYFRNRDLTTINETVANMVGRELSAELRKQSPLMGVPVQSRSSAPPPDRSINIDRLLHQLRVDVDALLADGDIGEAELRMSDARAFLAGHGYYLPVINQAYFAFYGTYADTPASSSPLGPRLASLRGRYTTLSSFVRAVQDIRSAGDLNRLFPG
jgi:hypothetical protein